VWKRLKKNGLTFDDFCKRVKRVKKVGKKLGRAEKIAGLKPDTYKGEERGRRKKGWNGGAGCKEQTQNMIA
jgi:hypothetical protein